VQRLRRHGATFGCFAWSIISIVGCDNDVWSESRQVDLASSDLHPAGTFVSGDRVLERSRLCLQWTGHRISAGEPVRFERASDAELRACYEERIRGPAVIDDEGCLLLSDPAVIEWEMLRRPCSLDGDFDDDRLRLNVVALSDVRGVFEYAVPLPREILGWQIVREAPAELPDGMVAAAGEPIRVIEDLARWIRTRVVAGPELENVWVTGPTVATAVLAGEPSFEEADEPSMTLSFEGRAGDVFDVRLELPAGDLEVGEVHLVSRADVASLSIIPEVIRVAETDAFYSVAAIAVARDREGRILREPPVTWVVREGDYEIFERDLDDDGVPDPSPHATIQDPCAGARAGDRRSATLEGSLDAFTEHVTVEWQCVENHVDGCGCSQGRHHAPSWLCALAVLGFARRRGMGSGR
jgi:hypothetical protein